ncbi:OmpA family protein [Cellulomonas sp. APG4]|uniref:OmpA family protein n=1 Tax=Cellulomonas sp. APG4 TaxID=1538656 RepID=UPI00137B59F4|nr:OmpA family protein [Cellulomonas sp. APG4]NCT89594.1 OmpA family protein [Cellulomonas sp. APG4]
MVTTAGGAARGGARTARRWTPALVVLVASVAAGCSPAAEPSAPSPSASPRTPDEAPSRAEPVEVSTVLDGQDVDLEVGPLAVHDDVAVLRVAATTDDPTLLLFSLWEVYESPSSPGPNGVRLVDRAAEAVLPVARTADGITVSTRNGTPGGPATEADREAAGDGVAIVHATFAVPSGDAVDVLLPQGGLVADVPVVAAADAGRLTVPPAEIVEDPVAHAPTIPLESFTELVGGQVTARRSDEALTVAIASDVLFATDSDQLGPDAETALAAVGAQVSAHEAGVLTVVGHTDDVADEAYNLDLSQRRARNVADRLAALVDLSGFDVTVTGVGESEPVAAGTTPQARAANRRVELVLRPDERQSGPVPAASDDAPLAAPEGPSAPGPTGVSVEDGDRSFDVRLDEVRRLGPYVVGELEVTNTGPEDLAVGSFASGAWDTRGAFDASLQFAATNVTVPVGSTRLYPLDYVRDAEKELREPMADRVINGIEPGATRVVTVMWPNPGTDTITVEVARRHLEAMGGVDVGVPFRLTDVPVVDG